MTRIALLFVAFVVALPVSAQPFIYDCALTRGGKSGTWVSPRLVIGSVEPGQYFAVDELILSVNGGPVSVMSRQRGNRLIVEWDFENLRDAAQLRVPNFHFQATLDTARNTVRFYARPEVSSQTFSGSGACRKLTDTALNPNLLLNK